MARQPHPRQRALIAVVTDAQKRAGFTQRDLAARLGRTHSFTGKIEASAQQLKVLEFCDLAEAVGADPCDLLRQVLTWRGTAPRSGRRNSPDRCRAWAAKLPRAEAIPRSAATALDGFREFHRFERRNAERPAGSGLRALWLPKPVREFLSVFARIGPLTFLRGSPTIGIE